jgi:histidinol-phosphate aminotransferase
MPEPREAIKQMRPYCPPNGDRLGKLRLDFNENTVGCSPRVAEFLRGAIGGELLATYPDYEVPRRELASFLGVAVDELMLTNGTDEAIQVLVNTFVEPGDEVIVLTPSYAMYRFYAEVMGAVVVEVPYESDTLQFDLSRFRDAVSARTKAVLIANPNNPTGTLVSRADLESVLEIASGACVLVDEAYFEFCGETMIGEIARLENLFVSRTFSKAYGMAALRMGCLVSNSQNVAAMRKAQSPYSVNMLAALAAVQAAADTAFVSAYVGSALAGRRLIEEALVRLGVRHWPSSANFVLFDARGRADQCLAQCREVGILIRDRRHEISGALRVTAGTPEQVGRFIEVLERLWK